ncbi:hypothetical protein [Brevibacillus laterosporus]|uniref:hypothetical protein n=1 Tax=Brevibacillus laterosporus TaxID=1465 RepID=UPI003D25B2EC
MEEIILTSAEIAQDSFYRINIHRMERFMKKINRLNNRAVKLNCSPIIINVLGQIEKTIDKKTGEKEIYNCVTIEGDTYTLKATTKEHKLYDGHKQTVLTRCVVV